MVALAAAPALAQAVIYTQIDELAVADPSGFGAVGVAVDQASRDLYVTMPFAFTQGGESVERFDGSGTSQGTFAPGLAAFGVAVDPTTTPDNGDVYVYDAGLFDATPEIHIFSATGTPVGSPFSVEANLDPGTGVFDPQQIGTDAQGNVYYPNAVDDVIDVYSPTGTLLGSLNGSGATALSDPRVAAVDNNFNIYVADSGDGGRVVKLNLFSPDSSVLAGTTGAVSVAVDPASGDVFVGQGSGSAFHIVGYDPNGVETADFGTGDFADGNPFPRRIAVDGSSAKTKVYVSDSAGGSPRVLVYEEGAPPPTVTTMSASGVAQTTAMLAGTVAQSEIAPIATCAFEYTDDADFVANGFANASSAPCTSEYPSGASSLVLATANVSGLDPSTTYRFRLVAGNQDASGQGSDVVFRTLPNAPTVATSAATGVDQTRATLGGTVNPNGGPVTTCEIEFGTTTAYGQSRPCASGPGGGTSAVGVSADVAGLAPGTTYHFRVRAVNNGGATDGPNQTFKTVDRPDPCVVDPESCKPTDQCVVTPAVCKPAVAVKATVPGTVAVRSGRALVKLSCKGTAGATCKGTLRIRARIKRAGRKARTLTIGTARYELATGKSRVVRVRLSRPARTRLASKGRLRGRVTGTGVSSRAVLLRLRPTE